VARIVRKHSDKLTGYILVDIALVPAKEIKIWIKCKQIYPNPAAKDDQISNLNSWLGRISQDRLSYSIPQLKCST